MQCFSFCFLGLYQTSTAEFSFFVKVVNGFYLLIYFSQQNSITDIYQSPIYASRFSSYMKINTSIKKGTDFGFEPASHPIKREELRRFL